MYMYFPCVSLSSSSYKMLSYCNLLHLELMLNGYGYSSRLNNDNSSNSWTAMADLIFVMSYGAFVSSNVVYSLHNLAYIRWVVNIVNDRFGWKKSLFHVQCYSYATERCFGWKKSLISRTVLFLHVYHLKEFLCMLWAWRVGAGVRKHWALRQDRCQIANFRTRSMKYKPYDSVFRTYESFDIVNFQHFIRDFANLFQYINFTTYVKIKLELLFQYKKVYEKRKKANLQVVSLIWLRI